MQRNHEPEEEWNWLLGELKAGAEADENQFVRLDADAILQKAKALRLSRR